MIETATSSETQNEKPFLKALQGESVDRIPFWFMRQAGRYLPEYRELRAEKGGFLAMAFDPEAACEITMQPIRRFDMDAAIIFSDILTIPMALGQSLEFVTGEGPKLGTYDFKALNFSNFDDTLQPVYEAISLTRDTLAAEGYQQTALIGFAGAPWTVATYMIEGGSSRDFLKTKTFAYTQPQEFEELLALLTKATADYLIKQANAGAEALQIFDSWAGAVDATHYEEWIIKPAREIIRQIRVKYPDIPIIGFPKGSGSNYLAYAQNTGITAIGIDSSVSTQWARDNLQPLMPVQGNLDPFCLLAGGDTMRKAIDVILNDLSGGPFIFNLGHGIHKTTPIAHVEDMIKIVRGHCA